MSTSQREKWADTRLIALVELDMQKMRLRFVLAREAIRKRNARTGTLQRPSTALKGVFMKKRICLVLLSLVGLVGNLAWAGSAREDSVERLQMSVDVLHAIMATPDKSIPEEVLSNAKCIVVVPNLIKGGFIVGGKHGRGVASCRTSNGWSAPAFISVSGGSAGLQIGVEGRN